MSFFSSKEPTVQLIGAIAQPYDLAIATARTCYSSKGIITPEEVSKDDKAKILRDKIAESTRGAGHLTTRQHAHFVFALDGVSRSFIWSFLHSHPFYNSEQVSQRYVKVKEGAFTIPSLPSFEKFLFEKTLRSQMDAYKQLIELVMPRVTEEYYQIFPSRKKEAKETDRWFKVIQKKAYEVARYVLPIATQAYLYHTISSLSLLRYHKMAESWDTPSEQKFVINRMIEEVLKMDPEFEKELEKPISIEEQIETPWILRNQNNFSQAKAFCEEFDKRLQGKVSLLINYSSSAEKTLAQAVRSVLGKTMIQLADSDAIDLVLNPKKNPSLGDTLNTSTLSKLTRALFHVHFTFQKKMSHTGDSQDQRHRMTPASRPLLALHYFGEPDIIYPKVIKEVSLAEKLFNEATEETVNSVNELLKRGVSFEKAHYLLPNSWGIRFEESGDLLNWHHKWKLRTCYNAQEEIFYASVAELSQVEALFHDIGKHIKAPCYIRKQAQIKPHCPEGDRYCGVDVWNKTIEQYDRLI